MGETVCNFLSDVFSNISVMINIYIFASFVLEGLQIEIYRPFLDASNGHLLSSKVTFRKTLVLMANLCEPKDLIMSLKNVTPIPELSFEGFK